MRFSDCFPPCKFERYVFFATANKYQKQGKREQVHPKEGMQIRRTICESDGNLVLKNRRLNYRGSFYTNKSHPTPWNDFAPFAPTLALAPSKRIYHSFSALISFRPSGFVSTISSSSFQTASWSNFRFQIVQVFVLYIFFMKEFVSLPKRFAAIAFSCNLVRKKNTFCVKSKHTPQYFSTGIMFFVIKFEFLM